MTKEHFRYIIDRFNLMEYSCTNDSFRSNVIIGGLCVVHHRTFSNITIQNGRGRLVFSWLPSESFAQEIIDHIRETEVLFV